MINESKSSNRLSSSSRDQELQNCDMAVLLIKLMPFMQPSAQEISMATICRLTTASSRNQLRACQTSLLQQLIRLLEHHQTFSYSLIGIFLNFMLVFLNYFFVQVGKSTEIKFLCERYDRLLKLKFEKISKHRRF
jgi:hypothetical protein